MIFCQNFPFLEHLLNLCCMLEDNIRMTLSVLQKHVNQWQHQFQELLNCPKPVVQNNFSSVETRTRHNLDIILVELVSGMTNAVVMHNVK